MLVFSLLKSQGVCYDVLENIAAGLRGVYLFSLILDIVLLNKQWHIFLFVSLAGLVRNLTREKDSLSSSDEVETKTGQKVIFKIVHGKCCVQ